MTKHYEGNLTITDDNKHLYTDLTSVGSALWVQADFAAPNLTSVGGRLVVRADFAAPNLTSVGGRLYVQADFTAPSLTSVEGGLWVRADFTAPNLTSVEGEDITSFAYLLGLHWPVLITDNYISIGCQRHTKTDWAEFTDEQIDDVDDEALAFWREHKQDILGK